MTINLLPWRENKQKHRQKKMLQYGIFCMVGVFLFLVGVRNIFLNQLEHLKKQRVAESSAWAFGKEEADKHNKTLGFIGFLVNLPLAMKGDLYVSKIAINERLIVLNVYAEAISELEKFVLKIKKQSGIGKVGITSAAVYSGANRENEENKFILTFSLDDEQRVS